MKNLFVRLMILACLMSILLVSTGCVNGGAISSKSYGFSKGVTGKAAEPMINEGNPSDSSRSSQQASDAKPD